MNPLFWPTLILGALCFWLGMQLYRRAPTTRGLAWGVSLLASVPGILFVVYYTKLLGEPLWLYRFRAIPGSELSAAGLGLLGGMIQGSRANSPRFKKLTSVFGLPVLFAFLLIAPHLKPLLRPLRLPVSPNAATDGVCLQSTPSTCGPASAVTLAKLGGVELDEHQLARECFTSERGTENWYLARALQRHGLKTEFKELPPDMKELPYPAVAGVVLSHGTGHFIPILGKEGTNYIVGDPMQGREVKSLDELRAEYRFTGFFLIVK
jgi:hypothetical protein